MNQPPRTPLHDWIGRKIGLAGDAGLTPEALAAYQLERLNQTLVRAREKSPFYKRHLTGLPAGPLADLAELARVPFMDAEDLRASHLDMLCVSQDEVARVVTMRTSGTTASPKRVYFSQDDLELTIDFFHHGMSTLVEPGQRVLVLMPGQTPASVGDLLVKGLARMEVAGVVHGPVRDPAKALSAVRAHQIDCLVGIPTQVLAMARHQGPERIGPGVIKSVLLSTDYASRAIMDELARVWGCEVFDHFGMTETGLGGGVECRVHAGCHLREADLLFEIIDPQTGDPLLPGQIGELVVTTLTRQAMPLIRYRTGDVARMQDAPCACGTFLRRLEKVWGRWAGVVELDGPHRLTMWELDEAVFAVPGVINYQAEVQGSDGPSRLSMTIYANRPSGELVPDSVRQAVATLPGVRAAVDAGVLALGSFTLSPQDWFTTGTAKRTLVRA